MRNSKNIFKFAADIISRYLRSNGYFFSISNQAISFSNFYLLPFSSSIKYM